jgi:hypothetical protein
MSRIVTVAGRRLRIRDREDWQVPSRPVTGPSPYPDLVHHFVVHWPGASSSWKPPRTFAETAAHLRWSQDMYLRDRGFSYGYGFVIGQTPINWNTDPVETDIWEVRGTDIRLASNDGDNGIFGQYRNPNFNGRSISAQLTASLSYPATDDQVQQARYLVALMDMVYGENLTVIPHRTSDSTSCPGDYILGKVGVIATRPTITAPPPPPPPPDKSTWITAVARCYVQAGWGPWHVGAAVMASFTAIRDANPGMWHEGDRVIVPGRVGVETRVQSGEGAMAILRRIHAEGGDTSVTASGFAVRELGRFYAWNGGETRVLRPGDLVFWPAP